MIASCLITIQIQDTTQQGYHSLVFNQQGIKVGWAHAHPGQPLATPLDFGTSSSHSI